MFSPDDFKLSFSTVAAPKLSIPQLAELAGSSGYQGIELVIGAEGESHAHGIEIDAPSTRIADSRQALADAGIEIACIASPLKFGENSAELVDDLKRYVTLSETMGSKIVRVYGGALLGQTSEVAGIADIITDNLAEAVGFAEQTGVSIVLETCNDFSATKYAREIAKQVYSDHFGVLWDIAETYAALETTEESYDNLSGQVKHVHVSDFRYADGRLKRQSAALGDGEVAYKDAIKFLAHDGFEGYLSVVTDLEPAEDILAQYAQGLHGLVGEAFPEPVETE